MDISPEDAEWILTKANSHNRRVSDAWVSELARRMAAELWRLTHQGIAFDVNGTLIDGQHRLWGVFESGCTVPMRIFLNEPCEAMEAIDTGRARTADEVISLAGGMGTVTPKHVATLRVVLAGLGTYVRRSPVEEGDLLRRHWDAICFALEALPSARFRGVANAVTRAVLARAWYSVDTGRLRRFADVLRAGIGSEESDAPITLLLKYLIALSGSGKRGSAEHRECYAKTQRALLAYLNGENLRYLKATTTELFPLPTEV